MARRLTALPFALAGSLLLAGFVLTATRDRSVNSSNYEVPFSNYEVRRDYEATVVATTTVRGGKGLLVNGVGTTSLTPITKVMAHLPLAIISADASPPILTDDRPFNEYYLLRRLGW